MPQEKTYKKVVLKNKKTEKKSLVLYNDDVNTFENVINAIIKICKHSTIQAEQCTWIVHFNGKCVVTKPTIKFGPLSAGFEVDRIIISLLILLLSLDAK